MSEERNSKRVVIIEDTKFIFRTNFAGDPNNDKYGSSTRKGNILIPDEKQAKELADEGFNVRVTQPKEGEEEGFVPRYFISIILNYDSVVAQDRPPRIYLVSGNNEPRELDPDTVGIIDNTYVLNVNVTLEKSYSKRYDKWLLYVRTMYVEQDIDDDPFAARYVHSNSGRTQPEGPDDDIEEDE